MGIVNEMIEKVRKTVEKHGLFRKGDRILIAYSGGADSTALFLLLKKLQEEYDLTLFLGHFNHKLRAQADEDEAFVRRTAHDHSLRLFVGSEDVRSYAKTRKLNLEEAGRMLRYEFLRETARKISGAKIATGHTMTDQAETFFMRIIRGSGLRGLAGIFPVVEKTVIRPLLGIERKEVEEYLAKREAEFCVDESNFDRRYLRNKIRLDLIPFIQKGFDPKIVPRISRIVSILQEEEALLGEMAEKEAARAFVRTENAVRLDADIVSSLPRGLGRRVVRDFIALIKGDLRGITYDDVESVLEMKEGKKFCVKKGLVLQKAQGHVCPEMPADPEGEYEYLWDGKTFLEIEELGLVFAGNVKKRSAISLVYDDETQALVDAKKLEFPLVVRNRREGDRYQPLGSPGKKKLKEIMRAKGIPVQERGRRPVFLSGGKIIWVLGLPASEKHKVSDDTDNVFMIQRKESREKVKSEK